MRILRIVAVLVVGMLVWAGVPTVGEGIQTLASTLPNATELLSGGYDTQGKIIYTFGGRTSTGRTAAIVSFNPANGAVASPANLPQALDSTSAVWDSNAKVFYVFGGIDSALNDVNTIVKYTPGGAAVTQPSVLPTIRSDTSAVWDSTNQVAYIFGGKFWNAGDTFLNDIIKYTPANGQVVKLAATLPTARYATSAVWDSANQVAYIIGGTNGANFLTGIVQFNPATGNVATVANLPVGLAWSAAVYDGGDVYIAGGGNAVGNLAAINRFNVSTAAVFNVPFSLPSGRLGLAGAGDGKDIYWLGGETGCCPRVQTNEIVKYTPNRPPAAPALAGPTRGDLETSYAYTVQAADPDADQISYFFDWDDGTSTTTALLASGTAATRSHAWATEGVYAVRARADDGIGHQSKWSTVLNVTVGEGPTAAITSPLEGAFFNTSRVIVEGTAWDNDGVGVARVEVAANQGAPVAATGINVWNAVVDLLEGPNEITATAYDALGYNGSSSVNVTVDLTPPVITLMGPDPGESLERLNVSVHGNATDSGSYVDCVEVVVDTGDRRKMCGTPGPDIGFGMMVDLETGTNVIDVYATDTVGNVGTIRVSVVVNIIPPSVDILEPIENAIIKEIPVKVVGVSAGVIVKVEVGPAGGPYVTTEGISAWEEYLVLPAGEREIEASATDVLGTTAVAFRKVRVDLAPPDVSVLSPSDGAEIGVSQGPILVSGTAKDDLEVASIEIRADGGAWKPLPGLSAWSSTLQLEVGAHTIEVRAADVANRTTVVRWDVEVIDDIPPVLDIETPREGESVATETAALRGNVSDNMAVSSVEVSIDGGTWKQAVFGDVGRWSYQASLKSGAHKASVRAKDGRGNQAVAERNFTVSPGPSSTEPTIRITKPLAGDVVNPGTLIVMGDASAASGVARVEVRVDDRPWKLATGAAKWSVSISMADKGEHLIVARVTDNAGRTNETSVVIRVAPGATGSDGTPSSALPLAIALLAIVVVVATIVLYSRLHRSGGVGSKPARGKKRESTPSEEDSEGRDDEEATEER